MEIREYSEGLVDVKSWVVVYLSENPVSFSLSMGIVAGGWVEGLGCRHARSGYLSSI